MSSILLVNDHNSTEAMMVEPSEKPDGIDLNSRVELTPLLNPKNSELTRSQNFVGIAKRASDSMAALIDRNKNSQLRAPKCAQKNEQQLSAFRQIKLKHDLNGI